jgi:hypothetical protein
VPKRTCVSPDRSRRIIQNWTKRGVRSTLFVWELRENYYQEKGKKVAVFAPYGDEQGLSNAPMATRKRLEQHPIGLEGTEKACFSKIEQIKR